MARKDKTTVPINALEKNATRPVAPIDPLIGHRIAGRYELIQALASGGFGRVYKARDTKLDRVVAIKLVNVGAASEDTRTRMLREARANARLHHPNVVVLHDAGEDTYGLYLVLEYVAGTSLGDVLANGPVEPHRAAEIARECAIALAAAHAHGIVHRDIKPANILLTENGRVKVADFGVARMVGEARLTDRGSIIGTPNYMAPEQIDGTEVGPEADMFALGCVLYESLAGRPPFDGETTSEVLGRILRGSPDPLPPMDHAVAPLVDAITSLLDKDPERRLRPNELIQRLRSWEQHDSLRPRRFGRRVKGAIVAAVAIVAAIVGASLALRDSEPEITETPPPPILVRVAEPPGGASLVTEETIHFSSRDALFAYIDFVGRDREGLRKVSDRAIAIKGPESSVRLRAEQAKIVDQLLGHDFFAEPSLLRSGGISTRRVSCDFAAIQPSELIALFAAATGWPVVQSADVPLASSAYLRVAADDQPWDDVILAVLRAAGLSVHRYESIWLVTAENVAIVPPSKVLIIHMRAGAGEDVRQLAATALSDRGVAWTSSAGDRDAVIVVDEAGGIEAVNRILDGFPEQDLELVSPPRFSGPPVSLRLDMASLHDVLDFYGNLTNRPNVVAFERNAWVRANIVDVPADEHLRAVLDANGLAATAEGRRVIARPFEVETIEVRPARTTVATFEPLARVAAYAAEATGVPTTIESHGDVVRIEGRNDVARDLAEVVRTIDRAMKP